MFSMNEEQEEYLLQVVKQHRNEFFNCNRDRCL